MDKTAAVDALRTVLHRELEALEAMMEMARDEATSPESRPENKYDTRALEASYLAAGQGQRLLELRQIAGWVDREHPPTRSGGPGALVHIDVDGDERWVLLAPRGGVKAEAAGEVVTLVSMESPLGAALSGLEEGDGAVVRRPRGDQDIEILRIL